MDVEPALLRDVEVLVGTSHRAVEVLDLENGMPTVLRAHFSDDVRARPKSVVVKRAARFDPDDAAPVPKTAWALFNEWTALKSLDGSGVAPRLLGANSDRGFLVMEDLGTTASLEDHLMGDDAGSVEHELASLARSVAVCMQLECEIRAPSRSTEIRSVRAGRWKPIWRSGPRSVRSYTGLSSSMFWSREPSTTSNRSLW